MPSPIDQKTFYEIAGFASAFILAAFGWVICRQSTLEKLARELTKDFSDDCKKDIQEARRELSDLRNKLHSTEINMAANLVTKTEFNAKMDQISGQISRNQEIVLIELKRIGGVE